MAQNAGLLLAQGGRGGFFPIFILWAPGGTTRPYKTRIRTEEIVIVNYPGPDRSVRLDQLRQGKAVPRRYRNRRIGDFLKELANLNAAPRSMKVSA